MRRLIAAVAVLSVLLSLSASAQEAAPPRKSAPSLGMEDLPDSRGSSTVIENDAAGKDAAGWSRQTLSDIGISMQLPGPASPIDISIPAQGQALFKSVKAAAYVDIEKANIVIACRFSLKSRSIDSSNLRQLAEGFVQGITQRPEVSDVNYNVQQISPSRFMVKTTYTQNNIPIVMHSLVVTGSGDAFIISAATRSGAPGGAEFIKRALDSVQVN